MLTAVPVLALSAEPAAQHLLAAEPVAQHLLAAEPVAASTSAQHVLLAAEPQHILLEQEPPAPTAQLTLLPQDQGDASPACLDGSPCTRPGARTQACALLLTRPTSAHRRLLLRPSREPLLHGVDNVV